MIWLKLFSELYETFDLVKMEITTYC